MVVLGNTDATPLWLPTSSFSSSSSVQMSSLTSTTAATASRRRFLSSAVAPDSQPLPDVKVVFIGDSGVGKTALLRRFVEDRFISDDDDDGANCKSLPSSGNRRRLLTAPTIGIDFLTRRVARRDGTVRLLRVWDTAGQERFRDLMPSYVRSAAVVVIVFNITDVNYKTSVQKWLNYILREHGTLQHVIVVGNQSDRVKQCAVNASEIVRVMEKLGVTYIETSAKTGENVTILFELIAELPRDFCGGGGGGGGDSGQRKTSVIHLSSQARPSVWRRCCTSS